MVGQSRPLAGTEDYLFSFTFGLCQPSLSDDGM